MTRDEILNQLNTIILWADECAEMEIDGDLLKGIVAARDLLDIPQPDSETGLMPCGCGGKAKEETYIDEIGGDYISRVFCEECGIATEYYSDGNVTFLDWNRAMGRKLQ